MGGEDRHWRLSFDLYTSLHSHSYHTHPQKRLAKKEKRMCLFHLLLYNSLAPWDFHSRVRNRKCSVKGSVHVWLAVLFLGHGKADHDG